ncbi:MAG: DUF308 domain-containing protein [Victivallaceae bacterium]|nr:DUF308 domain-containing protein [Victivallaceae bacterium]
MVRFNYVNDTRHNGGCLGIVLIVFGICAVSNPTGLMGMLTWLAGISMIIAAVTMLWLASCPIRIWRTPFYVVPVMMLLCGIVALAAPTGVNLLWLVFLGAGMIWKGIKDLLLLGVAVHKYRLFADGALSLLTGIFMCTAPLLTLNFIGIYLGCLMIVNGVCTVVRSTPNQM